MGAAEVRSILWKSGLTAFAIAVCVCVGIDVYQRCQPAFYQFKFQGMKPRERLDEIPRRQDCWVKVRHRGEFAYQILEWSPEPFPGVPQTECLFAYCWGGYTTPGPTGPLVLHYGKTIDKIVLDATDKMPPAEEP